MKSDVPRLHPRCGPVLRVSLGPVVVPAAAAALGAPGAGGLPDATWAFLTVLGLVTLMIGLLRTGPGTRWSLGGALTGMALTHLGWRAVHGPGLTPGRLLVVVAAGLLGWLASEALARGTGRVGSARDRAGRDADDPLRPPLAMSLVFIFLVSLNLDPAPWRLATFLVAAFLLETHARCGHPTLEELWARGLWAAGSCLCLLHLMTTDVSFLRAGLALAMLTMLVGGTAGMILIARAFERRYGHPSKPVPISPETIDERIEELQYHASLASASGFEWVDAYCVDGPETELAYAFKCPEAPLFLTISRRDGPRIVKTMTTYLERSRVLITTTDRHACDIRQPPETFIQVLENVEYHILRSTHLRAMRELERSGFRVEDLRTRHHYPRLNAHRHRIHRWVRAHRLWPVWLLWWRLDLLGIQRRRYRGPLDVQIREGWTHLSRADS